MSVDPGQNVCNFSKQRMGITAAHGGCQCFVYREQTQVRIFTIPKDRFPLTGCFWKTSLIFVVNNDYTEFVKNLVYSILETGKEH